jgi:hypothetical protein
VTSPPSSPPGADRRAEAIAQILAGHRYRYRDEDDLQRQLADVLGGAGLIAHREVRLSGRDRLDLLVYDVGIEVKVGGSTNAVLAQLLRYSEHPTVGALVLVTNRARHTAPSLLGGKPVRVVKLLGGL